MKKITIIGIAITAIGVVIGCKRGLNSFKESVEQEVLNNLDRHKYDRFKKINIYNDVILESKNNAEEVLCHLVDNIHEYGAASVGDFYELVGITASFKDSKYGWTDLSNARVVRVKNGYALDLPKAKMLD